MVSFLIIQANEHDDNWNNRHRNEGYVDVRRICKDGREVGKVQERDKPIQGKINNTSVNVPR